MQTVKRLFKRKKKTPSKESLQKTSTSSSPVKLPQTETDQASTAIQDDVSGQESSGTDPGYSVVRKHDRRPAAVVSSKANVSRTQRRASGDSLDSRPRMRSPAPSDDERRRSPIRESTEPTYAKVVKNKKRKNKNLTFVAESSSDAASPEQRKKASQSPRRFAFVRKTGAGSFIVEKDSASSEAGSCKYHVVEASENDDSVEVTDTSVFPTSSPDIRASSTARRRFPQLSLPETIYSEGEIIPSGDEQTEYNHFQFAEDQSPATGQRRRLSSYDHVSPPPLSGTAYEKIKSAPPDVYTPARAHSTPLVAAPAAAAAATVPRSYSESPSQLTRSHVEYGSRKREGFNSEARKIGVGQYPLLRLERDERESSDGVSRSLPSSGLEEYKARLFGLQELVSELQKDKDRLKSLAARVTEDGGTLLLAQKQSDILLEENVKLKDAVRRLNVELSRYQVKNLAESANAGESAFSHVAPLDVNEVNPLLRAYDEKLGEREAMLSTYEEHFGQCRRQLADQKHENDLLKKKMNETKSANPVSREEWSSIQEQIKLVLEENALLVEQQEAETRKLTARLATKDAEVLALKEKVASTDEEINRLKKRVKEVHGENELLRDHYERVKEDSVRKMSVEEHRVSLEECSKVAAELEVRFRAESLNVRERLDAVNKEKNSLSVHLADSEAEVMRLETEVDTLRHSQKKQMRMLSSLRSKAQSYKEKHASAVSLIQKTMMAVERAQVERDAALEQADGHRQARDDAVRRLMESDIRVGEVQQKLEAIQIRASKKFEEVKRDLNERDREHRKDLRRCHTEMKKLRSAVKKKQDQLTSLANHYRLRRGTEIQSLLAGIVPSGNDELHQSGMNAKMDEQH